MSKTGSDTHVATKRGYADRRLIEPGQTVPGGIPVGSWMEEKPKGKAKAEPKGDD